MKICYYMCYYSMAGWGKLKLMANLLMSRWWWTCLSLNQRSVRNTGLVFLPVFPVQVDMEQPEDSVRYVFCDFSGNLCSVDKCIKKEYNLTY